MRFEKVELQRLGAGLTGAARLVERLSEKTLIIDGAFTGTFNLEASLDGSAWAPLTPRGAGTVAITAPGAYLIDEVVRYVRLRTVALSAGTPTASIGGLDVRAV